VKKLVEARLPLSHGAFSVMAFGDGDEMHPHVVLRSNVSNEGTPLVRVHSECMTGDVFGSTRCDCGDQLNRALASIAEEGGMLIYLRQEGRGIGLVEKLKAYNLQDQGMDTIEANEALGHPSDGRSFAVAAEILEELHVKSIRLLTNNPAKIEGLEANGIQVEVREPLIIEPLKENARYLAVKKALMGHLLD